MSESGKPETITVEVAYATPARQVLVSVRVVRGTTVEGAIRSSGILETFLEIDLGVNAVGIFGERARLNDLVNEGDRVEIYRALVADPKRAHRRRAARQRRQKQL